MPGPSANSNRDRAVRLALAIAPVLFAAPVLYALTASFVDVVSTGHPFFGDISGVNADARSISLGGPLYQDPNVGYTPLTYTPLMSILGAGLDLITAWDGWLMVLTIVGDVLLVAVASVLAYRRLEGSRLATAAAVIGAVGMGALAFWLVEFVPFSSVYAPRPDQLAWALALTGLVLVPAAARGSTAAGIAAVALLSLGWWTKQTALVAPVAASAWLAFAALRGTTSIRRCLVLVGAIAGIGVASFALAGALTSGWSTTFLIDIPADRARPVSVGSSINDLITSVAPAAIVAAALWATAFVGRRPRPSGIAGILALFILLDGPVSVWFRLAVGSTHSQFVGVAWALALLAALGWRRAQSGTAAAVAAASSIVVVLFVLSEIPAVSRGLHHLDVVVPAKSQRALVFEQPAALVSYSRDHLVYHPGYAGIGVDREGDLFPDQFNVTGLNRAGRAAGYLERGLLDRRFDLVYPFSGNGDPGPWEANYFWKLNRVIAAKYEPSDALPQGLSAARVVAYPFASFVTGPPMVRRPGPDPAPWMARCFAPFEIGGTTWTIGAGGGFWCRPPGRADVLHLRESPAPVSEIRADDYSAGSRGAILITAPHAGTVVAEVGGATVQHPVGPRTRVRVIVPSGSRGLRIRVSTPSHALVDLSGLAPD